MPETVETPTTETPVAKLTPFQEWAATPDAEQVISSETEIDTASETEPASEPEAKAEADKGKPSSKGLKKRFSALTSEIRELKAALATGKPPAAAADEGVATPPKSDNAKVPQTGKPVAANFDSYEDYVDALTDWKIEQRETARQVAAAESTHKETVKAQVEAARARHADYDQVVTDKVPISQAMAEVMVGSEHGADIAYYLGQNPAEAKRIAALSPAKAGAALARIEASLDLEPAKSAGGSAAEPKTKANTTKAPAPPKVVTGTGGAADPEPDPKNFTKWEKWYERQQKAKASD